MNYDNPELLDRLAAEYVFGSLSSRTRRRFERVRQRLPAAEKAVLDWERRLMPLSGSVPPEQPPVHVWKAIDERTGGGAQSYVGLLTDAQNNAVLLASSTRYGRILSLKRLRPLETPSGHLAVLWALPSNGQPFAVGVVPDAEKATVMLADTSEKLFSNVPRLAVSFETGVPAPGAIPSPFVLTGHCVKLW